MSLPLTLTAPKVVASPRSTLKKSRHTAPEAKVSPLRDDTNSREEDASAKPEIDDFSDLPKRAVPESFLKLWQKHSHGEIKNNPFANIFWWWKNERQNDDAIVWLRGNGEPEKVISWNAFVTDVRRLGYYLVTHCGLKKGERVMLCYAPGTDFIIAFFACVTFGIVAVPVYPPNPAEPQRDVDRFLDIRRTAGVKFILTNKFYSRIARLMYRLWRGGDARDADGVSLGPPTWVCTDSELGKKKLVDIGHEMFPYPKLDPNDVAFLQFTSGCTSAPKGVVVTHGSFLHNCHLCGAAYGFNTALEDPSLHMSLEDNELMNFVDFMQMRHKVSERLLGHPVRLFSWLPVYHDMGLIGMLSSPLLGGIEVYHMSPIDFMKTPEIWLYSMSKYQCIATAAPNFAFELAVKRTPLSLLSQMDLRYVCGILCGAEPVRTSTMNRFLKKFDCTGLREDAIIPAYGLAENTLIVSSRNSCHEVPKILTIDAMKYRVTGDIIPVGLCATKGLLLMNHNFEDVMLDNDETQMTFVGCGAACREVDVRIVDPETMEELKQPKLGEVWISSMSTARGYFNLREKTEEDFYIRCKFLDGTLSEPCYFRTGDSGFIFGKDLFIGGRLRDMLVVRGKNFFPQDIEAVVDQVPEVRSGCVAAFATDNMDGSELCICAELRDFCFSDAGVKKYAKMLLRSYGISTGSETVSEFTTDAEFYADVCNRVARSIMAQIGLKVHKVILLEPRSIAKTTSGKVRRSTMKTRMLHAQNHEKVKFVKTFEENAEQKHPITSLDDIVPISIEAIPHEFTDRLKFICEHLISCMCDVVDMTTYFSEQESRDKKYKKIKQFLSQPIFELGLDSPALIEFGQRLTKKLGLEIDILSPTILYKHPTLESIIVFLANELGDENHGGGESPESEDNEALLLSAASKDSAISDNNTSLGRITSVESVDSAMMDDSILSPTSDDECTQNDAWTLHELTETCLSIHPKNLSLPEPQSDPKEDLKKLSDHINLSLSSCISPTPASEWTDVLLTGATGFLGRWQLVYLLRTSKRIKVHCMIRAASKEEGMERIEACLKRMCVWQKSWRQRIFVILGDISRKMFGMTSVEYSTLAKMIHCVVHTGADINLFKSYSRLRGVNVMSVIGMIEFCSTIRLKALHFASTLGIFPSYFSQFQGDFATCDNIKEDQRPTFAELREVFPPQTMGYPWTKLVAEHLLIRASYMGLPVVIYRYPLMCLCYENGWTQNDNMMIPIILSSIQEGIIPKNFVMTAASPADIAAMHSVNIMLSGVGLPEVESTSWATRLRFKPRVKCSAVFDFKKGRTNSCTVFHIVDTRRLDGVQLAAWISELGIPLDTVNDPATLLSAAKRRGEKSALASLFVLANSHMGKLWFAMQSHLRQDALPISCSQFQAAATAARRDLALQDSTSIVHHGASGYMGIWPPAREVFKRALLHLIKEGTLVELSAAATGGSVVDMSKNITGVESQLMTNQFIQGLKASKTKLSLCGQIVYSIWAKYAHILATELHSVALQSPLQFPSSLTPPVLLIVGADRLSAAALQSLIVKSEETFTSPSLNACLPKSMPTSFGVDLFEVYESIGFFGIGNTMAVSLLDEAPFSEVTKAPGDDTLLMEMLPGGDAPISLQCCFGLQPAESSSVYNRYAYHRQFLTSRELYVAEKVLVLTSTLHAVHINELKMVYPNLYMVYIKRPEDEEIEMWEMDAVAHSRTVETPNTAMFKQAFRAWRCQIHESLKEFRRRHIDFEGRILEVQAKDIIKDPIRTLNRVYDLMGDSLPPIAPNITKVVGLLWQQRNASERLLESKKTMSSNAENLRPRRALCVSSSKLLSVISLVNATPISQRLPGGPFIYWCLWTKRATETAAKTVARVVSMSMQEMLASVERYLRSRHFFSMSSMRPN